MELEELQKLFDFLFPVDFILPIGIENQKKYDSAFEELLKDAKIKKNFFIERESFRKVAFEAFGLGAKCLKLHLIQESKDLDLNIGISFSQEYEHYNGSIENDINFFWIIRNDILLKIDKNTFKEFKGNFIKNKLIDITTYTGKTNTQLIMYDIDNVLRYIIKNFFSNSFNVTGILINGIIFKDHDHHNANLNERVSLTVHTVIKEDFNQKDIASIGHDFGTVYP